MLFCLIVEQPGVLPSASHRGQEKEDDEARDTPGAILRNERVQSASSEGSKKSTSSEFDIAAKQEDLEPSSGQPAQDKSEKAVYEVPTGKFWLHDDRTDEDANNRCITSYSINHH